MTTKEEILGRPENLPRDNVPDYLRTAYMPDKVLKAMDSWARVRSIEFDEWIREKIVVQGSGDQKDMWFYMTGELTAETSDDLYTIFDEEGKNK